MQELAHHSHKLATIVLVLGKGKQPVPVTVPAMARQHMAAAEGALVLPGSVLEGLAFMAAVAAVAGTVLMLAAHHCMAALGALVLLPQVALMGQLQRELGAARTLAQHPALVALVKST